MKKFILSLLLITMSTELYGAEAEPSEEPSQSSAVTNLSADSDGEDDIDFLDAEENPYIANDAEKDRLDDIYTDIIRAKDHDSKILDYIFSHHRNLETNRYKNQYETLLTRMFADTNFILSKKFFEQVRNEIQIPGNEAFLRKIETAQGKHRARREAAELTQKKDAEMSVWNEILEREKIDLRFMNKTLENAYPEKVTDLTSFVIKYPAVSSIAASTLLGLLQAATIYHNRQELLFDAILFPAFAMTALWGTSSTILAPIFFKFTSEKDRYYCPVSPFLLTPFKLFPLIGAMAIGDYLVKTTPTIPSVDLSLTAAISTWILDAPLRKLLGFEKYREENELLLKSDREKQAGKIKRINAKIIRLEETPENAQAYIETDGDFLDLTKYYLEVKDYDNAAATFLKINANDFEKSMEDISNDAHKSKLSNTREFNKIIASGYSKFFENVYNNAPDNSK